MYHGCLGTVSERIWTFYGKKITVRTVGIWRIVNGKVVEGWTGFNFYRDDLNFFKQLGLIEYTEKGKKLFPQDDS